MILSILAQEVDYTGPMVADAHPASLINDRHNTSQCMKAMKYLIDHSLGLADCCLEHSTLISM